MTEIRVTVPGLRSVYRSCAKVNLYLDVLCRRDDGFHDIETVFQSVGLCDELRVEVTDGPISLTCSMPDLDCGAENLVMRAARVLRDECGCAWGAKMHLEKRIPVAAGLGGGSGDAAAALIALNTLWSCGLDAGTLYGLAMSLGSDVLFCMWGGAAAGTERGDALSSLPTLPERWTVLVHPEFQVSTAAVYGNPALEYSAETPVDGRTPRFTAALEALAAGDYADAVFNRMETPVFSEHPELAGIKSELVEAGCEAALMSGSGPAIFGVCADEAEARRVAERMAPGRCSVAPFTGKGVTLL